MTIRQNDRDQKVIYITFLVIVIWLVITFSKSDRDLIEITFLVIKESDRKWSVIIFRSIQIGKLLIIFMETKINCIKKWSKNNKKGSKIIQKWSKKIGMKWSEIDGDHFLKKWSWSDRDHYFGEVIVIWSRSQKSDLSQLLVWLIYQFDAIFEV